MGTAVVVMSEQGCSIEERRIDGVLVVAVRGTVDAVTAPQLASVLDAAADGAPTAVVVDLTEVDFLASSGMGALMAAHTDITPAIRFAVVADGPATSRPMKLIGLADVLGLYADLDQALEAVTG